MLFNAKVIYVGEQQWYYLTHSRGGIRGIHTFPNSICPKVNIITFTFGTTGVLTQSSTLAITPCGLHPTIYSTKTYLYIFFKHLYQIYLNRTEQILPLWIRADLRLMATKVITPQPPCKDPETEPHHQTQFSVISWSTIPGWEIIKA